MSKNKTNFNQALVDRQKQHKDDFNAFNISLFTAYESIGFDQSIKQCLDVYYNAHPQLQQRSGLSKKEYRMKQLSMWCGGAYTKNGWDNAVTAYKTYLKEQDFDTYENYVCDGDKELANELFGLSMIDALHAYHNFFTDLKNHFPQMTHTWDINDNGETIKPVIVCRLPSHVPGDIKQYFQAYLDRDRTPQISDNVTPLNFPK